MLRFSNLFLILASAIGLAGCQSKQATSPQSPVSSLPQTSQPDRQLPPSHPSLMMRPGPQQGTVAPDFTLKLKDGTKQVTLSDFRGKSPVVLVFGSFT